MKKEVLVIVFVFVLVLPFCFAETNLTKQELAKNCLDESLKIVTTEKANNFSVSRLEDLYNYSKNIYDSEMLLRVRNKNRPDSIFDSVLVKCEEIKKIDKTMKDAIDSFKVFMVFYNESIDKSMNSSSVDLIVEKIKAEISGERYENVVGLIEEGYNEIGKIRSEQTGFVLAYRATRQNVANFAKNNWQTIFISLCILIVLYLFYRTKISLWILNRKLELLNVRRETLKNLLAETQKAYFQDGKISDNDYRIRVKNFSDLVRDIDRQIPLIQQDIARYHFKQNEKESIEKLK